MVTNVYALARQRRKSIACAPARTAQARSCQLRRSGGFCLVIESRAGALVLEPAEGVHVVVHAVDSLEVSDGSQRPLAVRARRHLTLFAGYRLERMQDDLLEQ